jgi:hypothetical protein
MGYRKLSARPRHYAQNPEAVVGIAPMSSFTGGWYYSPVGNFNRHECAVLMHRYGEGLALG